MPNLAPIVVRWYTDFDGERLYFQYADFNIHLYTERHLKGNKVKSKVKYNQSVENAGVAFVKGANERSDFFRKNKQTVMYDEQVRTYKANGRTDLGMNSVG